MKCKVIFLQAALDDIEQIVAYIAQDNVNAALRLHDRIIETASKLSDFPMSGRLVPDEKIGNHGFRMIGLGNYIIFYKVYDNDSKVVVLRVLHGARDYPSLLIPDEDTE